MATKVSNERRRRRFDPQSRRPGSWRDRTSPAAREFLEFAHERLEQVEEAALAADPALDSELDGLVGDVAATCARVRIRLERNEGAPSALHPIEPVEDDGPSEGVLLLTRQLARAGAVAPEIEEVLSELGVSEPRKVVRRTLD
jgi:hypothetical protein